MRQIVNCTHPHFYIYTQFSTFDLTLKQGFSPVPITHCLRTFECLPGVGVVPELLRLLLEDPPLVVAGAVVVGVHEDAVQVPPQLILLPQDPVKLGRPELLRDRRPRLNIEIFS